MSNKNNAMLIFSGWNSLAVLCLRRVKLPLIVDAPVALYVLFTWKTCVPLAAISKTIAYDLHVLTHKQTLRWKKKQNKEAVLHGNRAWGWEEKNSSNGCWEIHSLVRVVVSLSSSLLKQWSVWVTSPQLLNLPTFPNCDKTLAVTYGATIKSRLSADCSAP